MDKSSVETADAINIRRSSLDIARTGDLSTGLAFNLNKTCSPEVRTLCRGSDGVIRMYCCVYSNERGSTINVVMRSPLPPQRRTLMPLRMLRGALILLVKRRGTVV